MVMRLVPMSSEYPSAPRSFVAASPSPANTKAMSPDPGAPSSAFESATSFCWVASSTKYAAADPAPSPPEYTTSVLAASRKEPVAPLMSRGMGTRPRFGTGITAAFFGAGSLEPQATTSAQLKPKTSQEMYFFFIWDPSGNQLRRRVRHLVFGRAESCLINARTQLAMHRQGGERPSGHDHAILFGRKARSPVGTA